MTAFDRPKFHVTRSKENDLESARRIGERASSTGTMTDQTSSGKGMGRPVRSWNQFSGLFPGTNGLRKQKNDESHGSLAEIVMAESAKSKINYDKCKARERTDARIVSSPTRATPRGRERRRPRRSIARLEPASRRARPSRTLR